MSDKREHHFEVAVIGAGPAGLQAAYYLRKAGLSYRVFEAANKAGAFFETYPVHRQLISINKIHTGYDSKEINLRWDWNSLLSDEYAPLFGSHSKKYFPDADSMVDYLNDYATQHELNIRYGARIGNIKSSAAGVTFDCEGETFSVKALIVATGLSEEFSPAIDGIEHAIPYGELSLEPTQYQNKRVLILGKGNSAFETADYLIPYASMIHLCSPHSIKMAWGSHYVGHLRAVNNNLLDTYQLKSQNAVLDAKVNHIKPHGDGYLVSVSYQHAQGEVEDIYYDTVIRCCGFTFNTSLFSAGHPLCEKRKYPVHDLNWQSSVYPNVYFAGTIMHYRDYKKYTSGFIHGFRYNVKRLVENLGCQLSPRLGRECRRLPHDVATLTNSVIDRINTSSALWQQPGFIGDFYIASQDGAVTLFPEQSTEYCGQRISDERLTGLVVTLEYGEPVAGDLFAADRIHRDNTEESNNSKFLHPILAFYRDGRLAAKEHVIEDLFGEWQEAVHIDFIKQCVATHFSPSTVTEKEISHV